MSTCLMSFLPFTCLRSAQQIAALYVNLPHVLCCPSCTSLITLCRVCPYPLSLVVIRMLHTTLRYANPYVWCAGLGVLSAQTLLDHCHRSPLMHK